MYIKDIFKYLSFKDKIRFASIDTQYRVNTFLKNKPSLKDIKPYYDRNEIDKLLIITKVWFDNLFDKMIKYYDIITLVFKHGKISLFDEIIKICNDDTSKKIRIIIFNALIGVSPINKRLTKKILTDNIYTNVWEFGSNESILVGYTYRSHTENNMEMIANLYNSFSHRMLTPKSIYKQCITYKSTNIMDWLISMRIDDSNIDNILRLNGI